MIIDDILGDADEKKAQPTAGEANRGALFSFDPPLSEEQIAWIESLWIWREFGHGQ